MLANVNTNTLAILLQIAVVLLLLSIAAGIGFIILDFIRAATKKEYKRLIYNAAAFLCMLIAIAGWVFNPGWIRFIFTFICIPIVHWAAFMGINLFASSKIADSKLLRILAPISFATLIVGYLFLPDFDDIKSYAFFGLIRNETVIGMLLYACWLCISANIFVLIFQLVEAIRTNVKLKRQKPSENIEIEEWGGDENHV